MAINPILNSISAALAQQSAPVSVKSSAPISSNTATASVTDSSPAQTVVQNASLLSASTNIAQLGSLLQVAQQGTEQVGSILAQLQSLAQQATSDSVPSLATINSEFQALLNQINQAVSNATFGGAGLLSGAFSGDSNTHELDSAIFLPDLTTQGLFGVNGPSISTPQDAQATLSAIATGQATVADSGTSISTLLSQLSFASASVETAAANQEAATSTLTEGDLAQGGTAGASTSLASNPSASAQAQNGNLSALLNLLQE